MYLSFALWLGLWFEHNLDTVVFFVPEDFVAVGSILQVQAMRDDEGWIDIAMFDAFQQGTQVGMHIGLPHFEGQSFGKGRTDVELIDHTAIYPWDRDLA